MGITCRKGVTPYNHSIRIGTYLEVGVKVYTTRAATEGSDTKLRRQGRKTTTTGIPTQCIPRWL
jgi:hypothetical protein